MKETLLIKNNQMNGYNSCIDFIDKIEKILDKSKFTIYDLDQYNRQFPKNIKMETRSYLKEPNKMNIHHYRCHIHVIADSNSDNTINGTNLEISFTLSHRFKAEKGANKHSHIYLSVNYDNERQCLVYDGYKKKNNVHKKILENTNPDELAEYLLYENYMKIIEDDFEFIEQPISEKRLFDKTLDIVNFRSHKYFKKSFFILRDNLFWSKLIKFSTNQLFNVLDGIFKLNISKCNIIQNVPKDLYNDISFDNFQELVNDIKDKHFPDEISTIPPHNKIKNFIDTYNMINNFEYNFVNLIQSVAYYYNKYFLNTQLLNKINLINANDNIKDDIKKEFIKKENYFSNLLKVLIVYILNDYIKISKNKSLSYNNIFYNKINYCDVVKVIINSIYNIKDKILSTKNIITNEDKDRYSIIYDFLKKIKVDIFDCKFLVEDLEDLDMFIQDVDNYFNNSLNKLI